MGCGCRNAPSDTEKSGSGASTAASSQHLEGVATVERCGRGFRGQMITPQGEILQRETAQTKVCTDDDCSLLSRRLLSPRHFIGNTCDEVHVNIKDRPVVDIWGAQARVICNGEMAQAISAGHDGIIGTCDDFGMEIPVNARIFYEIAPGR
jgi:hypothetical protein